MAFNPNIPLVTDQILISYKQLKNNFQAINNAFVANHIGLTQDATISGMHSTLDCRPQTGDPTTSSTQIALYNKLVNSIPELFFRPPSDGTPIQMTYPSIKIDGSSNQYSFIAGPFIVYGGTLTGPTNGQVITLTPGTTLLYVDLIAIAPVNPQNAGYAIPTALNTPANSFTFTAPQTVVSNWYYFAIGV